MVPGKRHSAKSKSSQVLSQCVLLMLWPSQGLQSLSPMEVVKPSPDGARRDGKTFLVGPSVIVDSVTVSCVAISPRMSMVWTWLACRDCSCQVRDACSSFRAKSCCRCCAQSSSSVLTLHSYRWGCMLGREFSHHTRFIRYEGLVNTGKELLSIELHL